ncbi:MAG: DUF4391 domain-containing protein [Succinivibrionaceae bacterium]|nr:DUF4391 domain-containing protein [Succinivibrionaceae bacterium]
MIDLPAATVVHRRLPKEAFYKKLALNTAMKDKFVSDVESIFVENSLTKDNLNLADDSEVKEILVLSLTLKKQFFDDKILEVIARQNPHKLVFLMKFAEQSQLALYSGKLYKTNWQNDNEQQHLSANGFTLEQIYNNFIEQIALFDERAEKVEDCSINERLALQEQILKLEQRIKKLEADTWKEQQPRKQFDMFTKLKKYKEELENLKHGQA